MKKYKLHHKQFKIDRENIHFLPSINLIHHLLLYPFGNFAIELGWLIFHAGFVFTIESPHKLKVFDERVYAPNDEG